MGDKSVLLLDDEEFTLEVLKEDVHWAQCGVGRVRGATSVREAKAFLKEEDADILLCDIEMPGESGLDLVEWAMEYVRFSGMPMVCIMLTCHPEYEFLRKAMQLGCLDYLLKPVDVEELEAVLKKAVQVLEKQGEGKPPAPRPGADSGKDLVRTKVLPYIEENLAASFSVSDLADLVSLNPQYLMRVFKKNTGMSILEYVTSRRMEKSKELLLTTGLSIENIAEEVGYFNYTYFMKVFKRTQGVSPGEYRRQYGH